MKPLLLLVLCLLLLCIKSVSQPERVSAGTIKSVVADGQAQTGLQGDSVVPKGTNRAAFNSPSGALTISNEPPQANKKRLPLKPLLIPSTMVIYGFVTLGNSGLKNLNYEFQEDIWIDKPHKSKHIDNYLMFAPAFSVYGLNAMGIKGKNNLRDRTMIYLLSSVIQNTAVFSIKKLSGQLRPDGSGYSSFPSGHTATAFASAEFLYQEYKEVSPWYGVAGYTMAAATGYLRMYNNKHWFSDVVTGAGIGILSTRAAYWIYPVLKRKLFKNKPATTIIMPYYQKGGGGVSLVYNLSN